MVVNGAEARTMDEVRTGGGIWPKTIDAITATNRILRENIWTNVQRKEPPAIFAVN